MTKKQQDELHSLLLSELQEIKLDLKEVRQKDIPALQTSIAVFDERLTTIKEEVRKEARRDARIYGGVGSAVATMITIAMALFKR